MGAGASAAHYIDDASAVEPSLIVGTLNMIADDANPWQFEPPSCVHPRFPPARPPRGTCAIGDARGGDARAPPILPPPHARVARPTARAAPREGQWAEGRLSRERTEGEEGWSRRARRRGPCRHVIEKSRRRESRARRVRAPRPRVCGSSRAAGGAERPWLGSWRNPSIRRSGVGYSLGERVRARCGTRGSVELRA